VPNIGHRHVWAELALRDEAHGRTAWSQRIEHGGSVSAQDKAIALDEGEIVLHSVGLVDIDNSTVGLMLDISARHVRAEKAKDELDPVTFTLGGTEMIREMSTHANVVKVEVVVERASDALLCNLPYLTSNQRGEE